MYPVRDASVEGIKKGPDRSVRCTMAPALAPAASLPPSGAGGSDLPVMEELLSRRRAVLLLCCLFHLKTTIAKKTMRAMPAIPPTTPPMRAF